MASFQSSRIVAHAERAVIRRGERLLAVEAGAPTNATQKPDFRRSLGSPESQYLGLTPTDARFGREIRAQCVKK
jgi:hypothetical protein